MKMYARSVKDHHHGTPQTKWVGAPVGCTRSVGESTMLAQVPMEKAVAPPWKVNGRRLQMEMVFLIVIGPDLYYCRGCAPSSSS